MPFPFRTRASPYHISAAPTGANTISPTIDDLGLETAFAGLSRSAVPFAEEAPRRPAQWEAPPRRPRRLGPLLAALGIAACAMAAIPGRETIVRHVPATARIYAALGFSSNIRGLALGELKSTVSDIGDRRVLMVEGAISNLRETTTEVPNLRISVRGADSQEVYAWVIRPLKSHLGAGERMAFRTRLASPPEGAENVFVRLATPSEKPSAHEDGA
jgi:hypothetical protein